MESLPRALRCPYCHDVVLAERPQRVTCVACAAQHHAECFVEGRGCAATACRANTARIGEAELPLAVLAELSQDPQRLAALHAEATAGRTRGGALLSSLLLVAFLAGLGAVLGPAGAVAGALCGLVLSFFVQLGARRPEVRLTFREELSFDPVFGVWRPGPHVKGFTGFPDAMEPVLARLEEGAPPPALRIARGPLPAVCPHCEQDLAPSEPDAPGEEEDEPFWFCYHCGGELEASGEASPSAPPEPPEDKALPSARRVEVS